MNKKIKLAIAILTIFLASLIFFKTVAALLDPSYVYCTSMGYNFSVEKTELGERGLCILPNGESVSSWKFLEGKVAQEYSYCKKNGYEIKIIEGEKCSRIFEKECAVCVLPDGSEIEVTDLMNLSFEEGGCGDGICGYTENFKNCAKDCASGSLDRYCDAVRDGKCDPDCKENTKDPDCRKFSFWWIAIIIVVIAIIAVILLKRKHK